MLILDLFSHTFPVLSPPSPFSSLQEFNSIKSSPFRLAARKGGGEERGQRSFFFLFDSLHLSKATEKKQVGSEVLFGLYVYRTPTDCV